jgi:integrase/recombinase XerD
MAKVNRNGQAAVLTDEQLAELLDSLPQPHRLIFAICYFCSSRIGEVVQLQRSDIVGDRIVFRARTTKTKQTREMKISTKLQVELDTFGLPESGYLFPGRFKGHLTTQATDKALRKACDYLAIRGASTHSFRRTGLTNLYRQGVPLKTLQQRTGHADLGNLAKYLAIGQDEVDATAELL